MHAAVLRVELRIPGSGSLKDKRRILKALTAAMRNVFPVAIAEVGFQDQWRRATLGIALVAAQAGHLERVMHGVRRYLETHAEVELLEIAVSYLEDPA